MRKYVPVPKPEPKICVACGNLFTPSKNDKRIIYCSNHCRSAVYNRRYYAENKDKFNEYWQRREVRDRKNSARRERYATDSEYREKLKGKAKDYNARKPMIKRAQHLREYGLTIDEYNALFEKQHGKCAICGGDGSGSKNDKLYIDHDHNTGRVRGLLCGRCNFALGHFDDDVERMKQAILYLESSKGE